MNLMCIFLCSKSVSQSFQTNFQLSNNSDRTLTNMWCSTEGGQNVRSERNLLFNSSSAAWLVLLSLKGLLFRLQLERDTFNQGMEKILNFIVNSTQHIHSGNSKGNILTKQGK